MAAEVTIFISYSHSDMTLANQIKADLQQLGVTVWIDHESIPPGHPDWQEAIRRGIEAATAVIYLGSEEACASPYVRREVALARHADRKIVPLFVRGADWLDCAPFEVSATQFIDVRESGYLSVREFLFREIGALGQGDASAPRAPQPMREAARGASATFKLEPSRTIVANSPIYLAAWATGRDMLATAQGDKTARVYEASTGFVVEVLQGHSHAVRAVAWAPLADRIATASNDQTVRIWDASSWRSQLTIRGHSEGRGGLADSTGAVWSVDWSPDGARLVTAGDDRLVRVWDARNGHLVLSLLGHLLACRCAAWSPDGQRIATAGDDGTARLWDATSGACLATLEGHTKALTSVVWSSNGKRLVSTSDDGSARIWSVSTGQQVALLTGRLDPILTASWTTDDFIIATGGHDETVRLWDAQSGKRLLTLNEHVRAVTSVQWERGRPRLATASLDQTIRIWELTRG